VTTPPEAKVPFEHLGDYDVVAPISEGGMASVWLGRSSAHPEQFVALKVIRPEHGRNKDFVAMFVDEVGLASRLSHTNIVSVRGAGHDGKQHFLVMELLRGHSFLEVWKTAHAQGKHLPWEVVAWIGARVADALHYAHELVDETGQSLHVVHRDVNPANIVLTREGIPKLIDFGLAKARDRVASTAFGVVKGKLAYLAPEQALGKPADRRSDIFALGVTLWETSLDRRLFFDDTDIETIRRVREADVPDPTTLLDGYPRALADAIVRALAPDPNDRWQTAAQLRDALDAFLTSAGHAIDASTVRTLLAGLFADTPPVAWERLADETTVDLQRTRIWKERQGAAEHAVAPPGASTTRQLLAGLQPRLLAIAAVCGVTGALLMGIAARGCSRSARSEALERRLAHIEDLLGIDDGGAPSPVNGSPAASAAAVSVDDRSAPCAIAKVAGYQAWQEALAKAKVNATSAEAACGEIWSDRRKQACYYAAMSGIRTTQAARDAVMQGGAVARDALKSVRDDAKNDAIARARSASDAVFAACGDDGGS
jgi:serine/threonine-protein kinase